MYSAMTDTDHPRIDLGAALLSWRAPRVIKRRSYPVPPWIIAVGMGWGWVRP